MNDAEEFFSRAPAWEFRPVFLRPRRFSLFFAVIVLGAWSVGGGFLPATSVAESAWDGGRNARSVVLTLRDGERLEPPGFGKRANAAAPEKRLRRRLHLD